MISLKPETFKISEKHTKTNIFAMTFILKADRENAAGAALLSEIFSNGSRVFKTPIDMNTRLNNMDGAVFNSSCVKKGDNICLCLSIETLKSVPDITARGFIDDIVFKPNTDGCCFNNKIFDRAFESVAERIIGKKDNKRSYAIDRCIEEMYGGKGFGIPDEGYLEDIKKFTPESLYNFYKNRILDAETVKKGIMGTVSEGNLLCTKGVKEIYDDMGVKQCRLCLGFTAEGADYIPLLVVNEILGGSAGSKLFNTVREKENLCYYVNSALYRFKNIIVVQAGIEKQAENKTAELIIKAAENFKNDITEEDIKQAKMAVKNIFLTKQDSAYGVLDNIIDCAVSGKNENIEDIIKSVDRVKINDIAAAAGCLKLNTKYFLA